MFGQTKQWTPQEDDTIRRMRAARHSYYEIGRVLGVSGSSVRRRCVEIDLVPATQRRNKPLSEDQEAVVLEAVLDGQRTAAEVAREIGANEPCVSKRMRAIRARMNIARPRREGQPMRVMHREPALPHLVGVPQISDRLAMTYDHLLSHEDRIEMSQTIAAACAVLREHYRRHPRAAV